MEFTLSELAAFVGGEWSSRAENARLIRGAAAISEALESDVTFYANVRYLPGLKSCRAGAVLVPLDFRESVPPEVIRVENPSLAFSRVVEHFAPPPIVYPPGIHPTAVLGADVDLGEAVSVGPYAVVEAGARLGPRTVLGAHTCVGQEAQIGADCLLHPRVTVAARCLLGDRVIVQSGAVIGSDGFGYEFAGGRHVKIPQIGIVQIESDVEIGANTTIDRARFGRTWIQEGAKIDNLVQIAHNVVIGKHSILVSQVGISGSTRLGQYVTLAGQVGVAGHLEIGDQVTVGAKSGIHKGIPAGEVVMGYPAISAKAWREEVAQLHRLGKLATRVKALESRLPPPAEAHP